MSNMKNMKQTMANRNDELYTPRILVEAILPYVPKDKTIWCPFDTENSEFVKMFNEQGNKVFNTHITGGKDFFKVAVIPGSCDAIISNPPFSKKIEVFDRLFEIGLPFAMLMAVPILNYQEIGDFFCNIQDSGKDLQLLIVNKKVSFNGNQSSFNTSYFCYKMLPKDLMFCRLEHNNTGKNYEGSAMEVDRENIDTYFKNKNGEFF